MAELNLSRNQANGGGQNQDQESHREQVAKMHEEIRLALEASANRTWWQNFIEDVKWAWKA